MDEEPEIIALIHSSNIEYPNSNYIKGRGTNIFINYKNDKLGRIKHIELGKTKPHDNEYIVTFNNGAQIFVQKHDYTMIVGTTANLDHLNSAL